MKKKSITVSQNVAQIIAANYYLLKDKTNEGLIHNDISAKTIDDIFSDTVLFVLQDEKAASLKTRAEIIDYFIYRFKMFNFRAFKERAELCKVLSRLGVDINYSTREENIFQNANLI